MNKVAKLTVVAFLGSMSSVMAEELPASAKKVTIEEFRAFSDKKPVVVVIYDMDVQITANLVWDWKKKMISGEAIVNGKHKIKVNTKLSTQGEKACAEGDDSKIICHDIYIEGDKFYEVRDDGVLHATSTLVQ